MSLYWLLKGSSRPSDLSEKTRLTSGMILGSKGLFHIIFRASTILDTELVVLGEEP